jgi:cytochrome b6-f complex iron-sulfur subunit
LPEFPFISAAHPLQTALAMKSHNASRREFCTHALTFVTVGSLLESCGGSPTSPSSTAAALPVLNTSISGGTVTLNIDASSPLATVGNAALVQTSSGNFLVARVSQESFNAMTAVCTHEACTVTRFQSGVFQCPCHGSEYNTTGAVTRGPASRPLRQFATQFANNVLTFGV